MEAIKVIPEIIKVKRGLMLGVELTLSCFEKDDYRETYFTGGSNKNLLRILPTLRSQLKLIDTLLLLIASRNQNQNE
jgi:hypothetical protein